MALEWWTATRFYQVRLRAISRLQKYLLSSDISQPPKRAEIRKVQMGLYVQYGCGFCAPEGWVNFDASPTLRIEKLPIIGHFVKKNRTWFPANVRYGDIVLGLPISNGSADAVYASHVLEHLAREDFETALRNTHRMLRPGGVFRLIVPDLQLRAQRYLQKLETGDAEANDDFIRVCSIGAERRPRGLARLGRAFGRSGHLWMWDWPSMKKALERAGFNSIRRCALGDSGDSMFQLVEDPGRFFDHNHGIQELAVHAIKS